LSGVDAKITGFKIRDNSQPFECRSEKEASRGDSSDMRNVVHSCRATSVYWSIQLSGRISRDERSSV